MERKNDEKDKLRSIASKSNPIPFVLKIVSVTAKFLMKIHQKKHLCRVESTSLNLEGVERDSSTSPSKLDSTPLQSKGRNRSTTKDTGSIKLDSIPPLKSKEPNRNLNYVKATSSSSVVDPVPLDLEIEILSRLPAKSLMKFQCVSKMWSSIIRSQSFVDSFFSMSSMTQSRFLISFSNGGPSAIDRRLFIFSSSHKGRESSSLETNLHMTIPSVTLTSRSGSTCVSVHGFLGIAAGNPFIVCNPITGKLTCLPGPRTSLGYDPVDDQFKALTMLSNPYQQPDFLVHEVITLVVGGESCWRRNRVITPFYYTVTKSISINGFVYFGAWTPKRGENPVIVCFDVRHERLSFIKAPEVVLYWEGKSILIDYKGKLASIAMDPYADFDSFDLWILEDADKHDWSKQTFDLPFSLGFGEEMISPGTNRAGEIIFAPISLLQEPFYIFYFNVDTNDIRKVMLKGLADDEHFRRRYGIGEQCCVHISPEHVESIASL